MQYLIPVFGIGIRFEGPKCWWIWSKLIHTDDGLMVNRKTQFSNLHNLLLVDRQEKKIYAFNILFNISYHPIFSQNG
jgi:hypothetical protein